MAETIDVSATVVLIDSKTGEPPALKRPGDQLVPMPRLRAVGE